MELEVLCSEFQLQRSHLDTPCPENHRVVIARKIGDWEALAPLIGVEYQDVEDIKEEHSKIPHRRLALLRKWSQQYGREATYLKLVESLMELGRRDVAEKILSLVKAALQPRLERVTVQTDRAFVRKPWFLILLTAFLIGVVMWIITLLHSRWQFAEDDRLFTTDNSSTNALQACKNQYIPPTDLPQIFGPFIGREKDLDSISRMLLQSDSVRIININGPPAFGKSTLAIRVGYELLKFGVAVRYIDSLEHRQYSSASLTPSDSYSDQTSISLYRSGNERSLPYASYVFGSELLNWAHELQNFTVLILDNCDGILHSWRFRDSFITLIKKLHSNKLKLIVTSQEQIMLADSVQKLWQVKELDITASEKLLKEFVTNISSEDAVALAKSVGGCPLALTVIGKIVHTSGVDILPILMRQLKNSPMSALDNKVSDKNAMFKVIMDTAYDYLDENLQVSGKYLCNFPGSFDLEAAQVIMSPYTENDLEDLVKYSLLEKSFTITWRYKMHKLIREYFREYKGSATFKQMFNRRYRRHYSGIITNFTKLQNSNETSEIQEHLFGAEKHNIDHLMELFKSLPWEEYSTVELSTLTLVISEKWIPLDIPFLEVFIKRLTVRDMKTSVCPMLKTYESCIHLYLNALDRIYASKCLQYLNCHSNLDCLFKVLHSHYFATTTESCNLLTCEFVVQVFSIIHKLSSGSKLSVTSSIRELVDDFHLVNEICDFCESIMFRLLSWVIPFLVAVFACEVLYLQPVYIVNHIIKKIVILLFLAVFTRFFVLIVTLFAFDILLPYIGQIANKAVLYYIFTPTNVVYTLLLTFLLLIRFYFGVVLLFSDNYYYYK